MASLSLGADGRGAPRIGRMVRIGAAALLGVLQAASLAWPGSGQALWWLQIGATAALFALLHTARTPRAAAGLAFVFAWAWLGATVSWLYTSLHVYGGLAAALAIAAVAALCAFLASYFALAAWVFKRFSRVCGEKPAWAAIIFSAAWLMAELARHSWFTGFPWGASAYAQIDGPLAFIAPYAGVYGIALVGNVLAASLGLFLLRVGQERPRLGQVPSRGALRLGLAYGALLLALGVLPVLLARWQAPRLPSHEPLRVELLQGNISQGEKFNFDTGVPQALSWYGQALLASKADLVVTPETALPVLPDELPDGYWLALQQSYARQNRAALIGMPLGNEEDGYANAVVGLKPSAAPVHYSYIKHHLVPFGEFIPPMFRWFTDLLRIPLGDFSRGEVVQPSFAWMGERFAPNICYEDLFGEDLAARFRDAAQAPTVLVNMSNLAWFGTGLVLDQHLNMARMRSLELDRPSLRATNTGMTVLIDRNGQVQAALPRAQRGVLRAEVAGNEGQTFFAQWAGRYGQLPLWAVAFVLMAAARLATWLGKASFFTRN